MNFALFEPTGVLAPLQGLMNWLTPPLTVNGTKPTRVGAAETSFKFDHPAQEICLPSYDSKQAMRSSAQRPLRIVRILEADHAPANVGRMVISGRMSDVCAELDRLAAKESALH